MNIDKICVGNIDNQEVYLLTIKSSMEVSVLTFGAAVTSILIPDKKGDKVNMVLGFESLDEYIEDTFYTGAVIGRFAGRIGRGEFNIYGKEYKLSQNAGKNHIHGGISGFNKKNFDITEMRCSNNTAVVELHYRSRHMEEGYPGSLDVWVTYEVTGENELIIRFKAVTDAATHLNLTNHSYFNLSGNSNIIDHKVQINAGNFLETDNSYIPTGKIFPAAGTPYDFRSLKRIGEDKNQLPFPGYNEYYILERRKGIPDAVLYDPVSGRKMEVSTSLPGLLFYTGDYLSGSFKPCQGVCFETQFFPDAPNHPHFPSTLLLPGEEYSHYTCFKFS